MEFYDLDNYEEDIDSLINDFIDEYFNYCPTPRHRKYLVELVRKKLRCTNI